MTAVSDVHLNVLLSTKPIIGKWVCKFFVSWISMNSPTFFSYRVMTIYQSFLNYSLLFICTCLRGCSSPSLGHTFKLNMKRDGKGDLYCDKHRSRKKREQDIKIKRERWKGKREKEDMSKIPYKKKYIRREIDCIFSNLFSYFSLLLLLFPASLSLSLSLSF